MKDLLVNPRISNENLLIRCKHKQTHAAKLWIVPNFKLVKKKCFKMDNLWADVADQVKELSSKPEKFLEPSEAIFEKTKVLAKVLYDASKLYENGKFRNVTLPELLIDSFDEEQVWAGVELQNTAWEDEFRFKLEKFETLSIRNADCFNLLRGDISKTGFEPVPQDDSEAEDEDFAFDDDDGDDEEMEEEEVSSKHERISV